MSLSLLALAVAVVAHPSEGECSDKDFPIDLTGYQYLDLTAGPSSATSVDLCRQACCDMGDSCKLYQFSEHPTLRPDCWLGASTKYSSDPDKKYISRGRSMNPPPPPPKPAKVNDTYTLDDSNGLGLRWEGVGAISGGGATTKLLKDYDPDVAAEVLDFLFKPDYGLNLQILKVEVGGDTDATEGAEPSHMHASVTDGSK